MNERKRLIQRLPDSEARPVVAPELPERPGERRPCRVNVPLARALSSWILTPYLKAMTRRYLRLKPAGVTWLPAPQPGREYSLYLHIPFCESLCPYCSFNRFLFNREKALAYFRALREELRMAQRLGYRFTSLYIGGGTPTILIDELCQTIDLARALFPIREVSCETNPNHLTPDYIAKLEGRVQRLSVGVQSFDETLLRQMGRYQKFGSGEAIQEKIRQAAPHFVSLNVDMIFNFPHQTEATLRKDVQMAADSGAQQVTFYPLMTSSSVSGLMDRSVGRVNYRREARFYEIVLEGLREGFQPMSAWTFSRQGTGMLDEYIVESDEYVGLGAGAFSFLDGSLYVNTFSPHEYSQAIDAGRMSVTSVQHYGLREQRRYRFMMGMFSLRFDRAHFKQACGTPVERGLFFETLFMALVGAFSKVTHDAFILSPRGGYLAVVMMREFFSGVNNVRDEARQALSEDERQCAFPLSGKQLIIHS